MTPWSRTTPPTENVTGDMDQVVREFARIANATDCAIEIVHHTRKPAPGQEELGVIDSRGAGAIINAVRSARVLNTMSKTEADGAGIDDVDRQLHFRIDRGKANMAPPTAARWYKFVGVELPNRRTMSASPRLGSSPGRPGRPRRSLPRPSARPRRCSCRCWYASLTRGAGSALTRVRATRRVFAKERAAKAARIGKPALVAAMARLFEANRIRVEQGGGKEHYANRLVLVTLAALRGADVAQTWRGVRPPYPLRRTYATERTPPLGLAGWPCSAPNEHVRMRDKVEDAVQDVGEELYYSRDDILRMITIRPCTGATTVT